MSRDRRWPRLLSLVLLEAIHLIVHLNARLLMMPNISLEVIELRALVTMVNIKVLRRRLSLLSVWCCWVNVDS